MDILRQDLAFAWRLLRRDRPYTFAVVLTLAVCRGVNMAIFTVVRSVLLRPLPYPQPQRLVFSFDSFPGAGVERAGTSVPNYFDRKGLTDVFEEVALYQWAGFRAGEGSAAEGVSAMTVTPSFFPVLGVDARLCREESRRCDGHDRGRAARPPPQSSCPFARCRLTEGPSGPLTGLAGGKGIC